MPYSFCLGGRTDGENLFLLLFSLSHLFYFSSPFLRFYAVSLYTCGKLCGKLRHLWKTANLWKSCGKLGYPVEILWKTPPCWLN